MVLRTGDQLVAQTLGVRLVFGRRAQQPNQRALPVRLDASVALKRSEESVGQEAQS